MNMQENDSGLRKLFARRNGAAVRKRLQWLEFALYWTGRVRREDMVRRWGISLPQASADIAAYQELAPGNVEYDYQNRWYVVAPKVKPYFVETTDFEAGLVEDSQAVGVEPVLSMDRVAPLSSTYSINVMRPIIQGFQQRIPLEIQLYDRQDKRGAIPLGTKSTICPHHLIIAPLRTYLRCWVKESQRFVSLAPALITAVRFAPESSWVPDELDAGWHTMEDIVLIPSPSLAEEHRAAAEREYGLKNGRRVIHCRACMVYYVLASMNLDVAVRSENDERGDPGKERNIGLAVENWQQLRRYTKERV